MRLLHTTELRFEEFFDNAVSPYAILSHRWGDDEVSYQDFLAGGKKEGAGYAKIIACCRYAAMDRTRYPYFYELRGPFQWVWIDTCCIDNSSSAELSEAINTMYDWYANAAACYAYLSDVKKSNGVAGVMQEFQKSKWFTRGWTLQELLAPSRVVFLNYAWAPIGTKHGLKTDISRAAGISASPVTDFWDWSTGSATTAEKFSWAANRNTSR